MASGGVVRAGAIQIARELVLKYESREGAGKGAGASPAPALESPKASLVASLSGRLSKAIASPRASNAKKSQTPIFSSITVPVLRRFTRASLETALIEERKDLLASPESASSLTFALFTGCSSKSTEDFELAVLALELSGALCELGQLDKETQNLVRTCGLLENVCVFLHTYFSRPDGFSGSRLTGYHVRCANVLFESIIGREANRDVLVKSGGTTALASALENSDMRSDQNLVSETAITMSNACFGDDSRKIEIGRRAIDPIQRSLATHPDSPSVALHCALALRNLSYNCEANQVLIVSENQGSALQSLLGIINRFGSKNAGTKNDRVSNQQRTAVHQALVALANVAAIREDLREKVTSASAFETVAAVIERANCMIQELGSASSPQVEEVGRDVDDVVSFLRNCTAKNPAAHQRIAQIGIIGPLVRAVRALCSTAFGAKEESGKVLSETLASAVVEKMLEWLRHAAFARENRSQILESGALTDIIVASIGRADASSAMILQEDRSCETAFLALGNSTFGLPNAAERARDAGALTSVVQIATKRSSSLGVTESALRCLRSLLEQSEQSRQFASGCGALEYTVDSMRKFPSEEQIQEQGCALLLSASVSESNLLPLKQSGAAEVVLYAMQQHPKHRGIHLHATLVLQRMNGATADDVCISRENIARLVRTARQKRRGAAAPSVFAKA